MSLLIYDSIAYIQISWNSLLFREFHSYQISQLSAPTEVLLRDESEIDAAMFL